MPSVSASPVSSSASAAMYTAWAEPSGTCELKITMLTVGRTAILRECRASGWETQRNCR